MTTKYFQDSLNSGLRDYATKIEARKTIDRYESPSKSESGNDWRYQLRNHNRSKSATFMGKATFAIINSQRNKSKQRPD